jgi:hypothetical protein
MLVTNRETGESPLHATLRPLVAAIDHDLAGLGASTAGGAAGTAPLLASWRRLVDALALGPAPELRVCPTCRHSGILAATRCGFCWSELLPLAHAGASGNAMPPRTSAREHP